MQVGVPTPLVLPRDCHTKRALGQNHDFSCERVFADGQFLATADVSRETPGRSEDCCPSMFHVKR